MNAALRCLPRSTVALHQPVKYRLEASEQICSAAASRGLVY